MNYAGTSFIKISDLGKLKYGSPKFNIVADRTYPVPMCRLASTTTVKRRRADRQGWDPGRTTDQSRNAPHQRELQPRLHICATRRNYPFLRMPNIQLEARPAGSPDVDAMIADVKDGILVDGMGSFASTSSATTASSAATRSEIKNGKKTRMVSDFTYNAIDGLLGQPRCRRAAGDVAARRHDRRRERAAGPVQSSVPWFVAVPDPPGHGRRGVRPRTEQGQELGAKAKSRVTRPSRAPSTRLLLTTGPSEAKGPGAGGGAPAQTKKMSYSREDVKAVTDKILDMAKADGVEIEFSGGERSATRYANSTITANLEHDQEVTITVRYGQLVRRRSIGSTMHR